MNAGVVVDARINFGVNQFRDNSRLEMVDKDSELVSLLVVQ
jgi:hypothetical protein